MNINENLNVQIQGNKFTIHYFKEYDFPNDYDPQEPFSWSGLIEFSFRPLVNMSPSQAEGVMENAKTELYNYALNIANDYPAVYDRFNIEEEFMGKVTYSTQFRAIKVRSVIMLKLK